MKINLLKSIQILESHGVIAIPTETVYGLAAKFDDLEAIEKIFQLKNRPRGNPLIIHIGRFDQLEQITSEKLPDFIDQFWPGALTLIVPALPTIAESVRANLPTVAVRMPSHPLTLELIRKTGPLVAPSANLSGSPSSTSPKHVENDFGKEFPVLDGGICTLGIESTIISKGDQGWSILREGSISEEELSKFTQIEERQTAPICPGMRFKHYSPKAALFSGDYPPNSVVLGFTNRTYPQAKEVFILGDLSKPETIGQNLYKTLRMLDESQVEEAWIDLVFPKEGILKTVHERLLKAMQ